MARPTLTGRRVRPQAVDLETLFVRERTGCEEGDLEWRLRACWLGGSRMDVPDAAHPAVLGAVGVFFDILIPPREARAAHHTRSPQNIRFVSRKGTHESSLGV
jgi:hypothetical protein